MTGMIFSILFFAIPVLILVFLGICIFRYVSAKKQNKKVPDTISPQELQTRKAMLVTAAIITGVLLAVVIGFIALLYLAVAFM